MCVCDLPPLNAESRTQNTILGPMPGVQKVEEKTMGDGEAGKGWGGLLALPCTMAPEQVCSGLAWGVLGEKDHCHVQQETAHDTS